MKAASVGKVCKIKEKVKAKGELGNERVRIHELRPDYPTARVQLLIEYATMPIDCVCIHTHTHRCFSQLPKKKDKERLCQRDEI